jgi:catechol 2,3-dioxygenase-like lactoylglutathione lyase family enzyme
MAGKMANLFNKLHHICLVVRDVEKAAAYFESVGIGPFHDYPPLAQFTELEMPNPAAFRGMTVKFADLSNVQIQLCQPNDPGSPQRQFLDTHGEGVFHLGFEVPDCDQSEAEARAAGIPVLMRGRRPDRSGFTYFDTAANAGGVVLEIRKSVPTSKSKA